MIDVFENADPSVQTEQIVRWPKLPINRKIMSTEFRDRPESDLLIAGAHMSYFDDLDNGSFQIGLAFSKTDNRPRFEIHGYGRRL